MEEITNFIENLEVQTLTDELKEDIMSIVNEAIDKAYMLGRQEGMTRAIEILNELNNES
jgi:hypothetical protein